MSETNHKTDMVILWLESQTTIPRPFNRNECQTRESCHRTKKPSLKRRKTRAIQAKISIQIIIQVIIIPLNFLFTAPSKQRRHRKCSVLRREAHPPRYGPLSVQLTVGQAAEPSYPRSIEKVLRNLADTMLHPPNTNCTSMGALNTFRERKACYHEKSL